MIVSCLQWWMKSFSSVHFVCFGEERNMHKCATTSWSSCLWKLWWAGVKHWRTAPHRFYVYRKPISSPRSRNLKVIKKMCTFEVHLCMMYGQLILSVKPVNTFSMARLKYCNCVWPSLPFPIPPRILLYKSLLPHMVCIFFSLRVSHHFPPMICDWNGLFFFILVTLHLCLLLIRSYLWNSQKWQILISVNRDSDFFYFLRFVTRKNRSNNLK
jgi:hypothetical protein